MRGGGVNSSIPITSGNASLRPEQISSNIACVVIGNSILALLIVGLAFWFGLEGAPLIIVTILIVSSFTYIAFTRYRLFGIREDVIKSEHNAVVFRYWEIYQRSQPNDKFTGAFMTCEFIFLYFLPLLYLCLTNNANSASLFAIFGFFSALRHYLNPGILLLALNEGDYFQQKSLQGDGEKKDWKAKRKEWRPTSLMYHIVKVGSDPTRGFWIWVYVAFVIFFVLVVMVAGYDAKIIHSDGFLSNTMTLTQGFTYAPVPDLPYPTCRLKKGFGGESKLQDFAFLSGLAYAAEDEVDSLLSSWYGAEGVATNNKAMVQEFKDSDDFAVKYGEFGSAVSYRFISFTGTSGIVTIRGTSTVWDVMVRFAFEVCEVFKH